MKLYIEWKTASWRTAQVFIESPFLHSTKENTIENITGLMPIGQIISRSADLQKVHYFKSFINQ